MIKAKRITKMKKVAKQVEKWRKKKRIRKM